MDRLEVIWPKMPISRLHRKTDLVMPRVQVAPKGIKWPPDKGKNYGKTKPIILRIVSKWRRKRIK